MILIPVDQTIETKKVLKKAITSNRVLSKLNGVARIISNSTIL